MLEPTDNEKYNKAVDDFIRQDTARKIGELMGKSAHIPDAQGTQRSNIYPGQNISRVPINVYIPDAQNTQQRKTSSGGGASGLRLISLFKGIVILGVASFLLLYATSVIKLPFKLPWEYDYNGRYAQNPAYNSLGQSSRNFAQLLRDFRKKHPAQFAEIERDANVKNGFYPDPLLWNINTHEAQLLLRASQNINFGPYVAYQKGIRNPYMSYQQATEIVRRVAK